MHRLGIGKSAQLPQHQPPQSTILEIEMKDPFISRTRRDFIGASAFAFTSAIL
jgi:hypothetical protein